MVHLHGHPEKSEYPDCTEAVWPPSEPEGEESPSMPKWAEPNPCPSHRKWVGGTESIKRRASGLVRAKTVRETEASCSLQAADFAAEPRGALLAREPVPARKLLGLLLALLGRPRMPRGLRYIPRAG